MTHPTSNHPPKPYVLHPGQGVPGYGSDVKAARVSTGGMITIIESHTDGGAPLHVHTNEDEYFYVLDGMLTVRCGDEQFEAGPRSFVFLPRGIPHEWDVIGDTATLLMITTPGMLEEFLHEFHSAAFEQRKEIAARYGITFL
jgi:mannose-6-phosphate isomerase-like protein (cupin superfamily)